MTHDVHLYPYDNRDMYACPLHGEFAAGLRYFTRHLISWNPLGECRNWSDKIDDCPSFI